MSEKQGIIPPGNMYLLINLLGGEGVSTDPIVCNKNIPSFFNKRLIDLKKVL